MGRSGVLIWGNAVLVALAVLGGALQVVVLIRKARRPRPIPRYPGDSEAQTRALLDAGASPRVAESLVQGAKINAIKA
ncbi:MAG: hypothetical protein ACHQ1E_15450, partial [Ktedonobacterales bacterium]